MAKPFVSHDGVDPNGVRAEVFVQTGTGTVKQIVENGDNVRVLMSVQGLKHPVGGWTSKKENIYPIVLAAHDEGREVTYRIESQRKQGIDRSTPISELRETQEIANENTRSLFVGVDGTLSSEAVTDPSEDPYSGGRIPATDPRNKPAAAPAPTGGGFSAEQALTGLANARKGGLGPAIVDAAAALALAAGASVEQVTLAGFEPQGNAQPVNRPQRGVAKEAAPYIAYNTDNRVNLGSYMVQAAVGAENVAVGLMTEHANSVAERHNAAVNSGEVEGDLITAQPVDFKNAAALASVLLSMADQVQVRTYGGGRPNRMGTSHTRARGYVYDAVQNRHPVPFGQDSDAQAAWKEAVVAECTARFQMAAAIAVQIDQGGAPARSSDAPEGQVQQMRDAAESRPPVLVEGDEGFTAPDAEILGRFGALAQAAGFEGTPNSPVSVYLMSKFGVPAARKVDASTLSLLVAWYEKQEGGAEKFRLHVLAVASEATGNTEPVETSPEAEVASEAQSA